MIEFFFFSPWRMTGTQKTKKGKPMKKDVGLGLGVLYLKARENPNFTFLFRVVLFLISQ